MSSSRELVYRIGEAADILGVSVPTLRLYEREGLILPVRKPSRHRLYSHSDLERIRCLRETINTKKVSIAGIRRLLALIPCWTIKQCPPDIRDSCPAFTNSEAPCWMVDARPPFCSSSFCHTCTVYRDAADCDTLKQTIINHTLAPGG